MQVSTLPPIGLTTSFYELSLYCNGCNRGANIPHMEVLYIRERVCTYLGALYFSSYCRASIALAR